MPMSLEKLLSLTLRVFFAGAFLLFALAVIERIANANGYTVLQRYQGGRILEFAAILVIFVIALQLREMKELLKRNSR
jgi:hypothetical protein